MEEWKTYKLGDVCSRLSSGRGIKSEEVLSSGIFPVIGGNGIRGYCEKSNFSGICGVIGRQGAYCGNVRIFEGDAYMTEHAVVVVGNEYADTRFLAYLLSLLQLGHLSAQSAQPGLSVQTLSKLEIKLPPLPYQIKVSNILKVLDTKIELNRRINDNLEQQAQALYKSWFVDFEPFKDGKFVDSELGLIPKGWQTGTLDELVYIDNTSINPALKPTTLFSHYSIPAFDNMMCPESQFGKDILSNKFVVSPESILLSKLNPRIKRIWCVLNANEDSVCSTEFVQLKAINPTQTAFAYGLITSEFFYQYVLSFVNGATGSHQRFHPQDILSFPLAYSNDAVSRFSELLSPMLKEQDNLRVETQDLCKLRDSILPKLMSGELKPDQVTL